MKIMVITHTWVMRTLCDAWRRTGIEVIEFPIPALGIPGNPTLKQETARSMCSTFEREKPSIVIDLCGAGIMPLDEDWTETTMESTHAVWCVWWWDAIHTTAASPFFDENDIASWYQRLKSPRVVHLIWDQVLAREMQSWLGRPVYWLPTATDPTIFHPEAAVSSKADAAPTDVTFFGQYYETPEPVFDPEVEQAVDIRMQYPALSYFEMTGQHTYNLPTFSRTLNGAKATGRGPLDPEVLRWKKTIEAHTGFRRRCKVLDEVLGKFDLHRFAGKGWPPDFKAETIPIDRLGDIISSYRNATLNINLGNGQAFTGSPLRCYEIMASAAVLAVPAYPDFDPDGELEGQAYFTFSSVDQLVKIRDRCRADPGYATKLGENARMLIREKHSWENRLMLLLQTMSNLPSGTDSNTA